MIKGILGRLDGKLGDGDVVLHNHPYKGAVHAPDVCVAMPIFVDGNLVAFSAASTHLVDLGGAFPGINVDVVDMWSEARIFDAVRLYEGGRRNEALWQHIMDNTRTPSLNGGDLEALIAACEIGKRRFLALAGKYGVTTVQDAAEDWMDYAEWILRERIRQVPDGTYEAPVAWLDDDGKNRDVRLQVRVRVTIDGSDISIDLTGSNDEVETGFNAPLLGATLSTVRFIVRTVFLDEATWPEHIPANDGMYRPIHLVCPPGTIFNPRFPRATVARFCPIQRLADSFILALADVIPDRVTGGNAAHTYFISYAGWDEDAGEYWAYLEGNEGSYGGRCGSDGMDAVDTLIANTRNTPIEELELRYPMRVDRYELRDEAPAPGRWRGGIGPVRENRFLRDTIVSCEGDRSTDAPLGVHGGHAGLPGRITHIKRDGGTTAMYSKFSGYRIPAGDVLRIEAPMGGGYGSPLERDVAAVVDDVGDGLLSVEQAQDYGVVISPSMAADLNATEELRIRLASASND
jgi:N-methylhydantoinase B/oxoprolinase/acetone carboxylase alpha subunit